MTNTIRREMTITHDDFFRLLPKALAGYQFKISGQSIQVKLATGYVNIQLMPETSWSIGALQLPATQVEITLKGCNEDEADAWLKKFDLTFQKGGG
jgi:alkyl hydroperoxide reductase subunit AhpF